MVYKHILYGGTLDKIELYRLKRWDVFDNIDGDIFWSSKRLNSLRLCRILEELKIIETN